MADYNTFGVLESYDILDGINYARDIVGENGKGSLQRRNCRISREILTSKLKWILRIPISKNLRGF